MAFLWNGGSSHDGAETHDVGPSERNGDGLSRWVRGHDANANEYDDTNPGLINTSQCSPQVFQSGTRSPQSPPMTGVAGLL